MFEGKHEAIISREVWETVHEKRLKTGYQREKTHSLEHSHILSGILKCPVCGSSMYGNVCRKKKKDSEEHYDDIWYYVCKHRRTVGSIPCTFNTYVRQEDIISEVLGIVKELFDRENISEYIAKDFLAESLDINKLQDDLKKLTKNKQKIEEKNQASCENS